MASGMIFFDDFEEFMKDMEKMPELVAQAEGALEDKLKQTGEIQFGGIVKSNADECNFMRKGGDPESQMVALLYAVFSHQNSVFKFWDASKLTRREKAARQHVITKVAAKLAGKDEDEVGPGPGPGGLKIPKR